MSNIIQINNLNKSFGSVNAVQNLSFRVKKGELFAFLGINGAGKSTTINIMCTEKYVMRCMTCTSQQECRRHS